PLRWGDARGNARGGAVLGQPLVPVQRTIASPSPSSSYHGLMETREAVLGIVREEGFELAGIAPAAEAPGSKDAALAALREGRLADMRWMDEPWIERATEPDRF